MLRASLKKSILTLISLTFGLSINPASTKLIFENNQHRLTFAQMYLGLEYSQNQLNLPDSDKTHQADLGIISVNLGGWHFWGLADFWVQIPIETPEIKHNGNAYHYSPGIETGFRLYPFRLKDNTFTPFLGAAFRFDQLRRNKGPEHSWQTFPLQFGLAITSPAFQLEAGARYLSDNQFTYPLSQSQSGIITVDELSWFIGLKRIVDTTNQGAKTTRILQAGFYPFLGLGYSSAWNLNDSSTFIDNQAAWLDNHPNPQAFPEFSLGLHWKHNQNLNQRTILQLVYRNQHNDLSGYGADYTMEYQSLSLEMAYSFWDYHGFVPFIGASLNQQNLKLKGDANHSSESQNIGLLFGWDIIPYGANSPWLLRTNLRWYPEVKLSVPEQGDLHYNNFEFNFIQWVYQFDRY